MKCGNNNIQNIEKLFIISIYSKIVLTFFFPDVSLLLVIIK